MMILRKAFTKFNRLKKQYNINKLNNEKGFTVIELMMAVTIAGMIAGAITSFLLMHVKSFELSKDLIDIQFEGQMTMNQMSRVVMEAQGIEYVLDATDVNGLNEIGNLVNPKALAFYRDNTHIIIFQYIEAEDVIMFRDNVILSGGIGGPHNLSVIDNQWEIFAENVEGWTIGSGVESLSFLNTDTISIYIDFNKDDIKLTLNNLYKMRNKKL